MKNAPDVPEIPGSFPANFNNTYFNNLTEQKGCVHYWLCDPAIDQTSLCYCKKCHASTRLINRVFIPSEKDGYTLGSAPKPGSIDDFNFLNGIQAEY